MWIDPGPILELVRQTAVQDRVLTNIVVENLFDLLDLKKGTIQLKQVRRAEIVDAIVERRMTGLGLSRQIIERLGLLIASERSPKIRIYSPVRLTIMDRSTTFDIVELPDEFPAIVGLVILTAFDLVIDPDRRRLIGNPAHGGEHMLEM